MRIATERLWGGDVEGELLGEIVDDARTWGDDHAAITAAGPAILTARGGVTAVGFDVVAERARDGFVMLETDRLGRGEVAALLVGLVPRFAEEAPAATNDEFTQFVELLELAARFELRLAEVDDAVALLLAELDASANGDRAAALQAETTALADVREPDAVADVMIDGSPLQPRFVSESYFLDFEFEPGNYHLTGREMLAGREVLRIEYYPTQLFSDTDADADADEDADEDKLEARVEAGFNKTSLVTLWVDPNEHQIVQFTFDNVGSRSASDSASSGWSWSDSLFVFCHRLASVFAVIRNNHATKGVPRH